MHASSHAAEADSESFQMSKPEFSKKLLIRCFTEFLIHFPPGNHKYKLTIYVKDELQKNFKVL